MRVALSMLLLASALSACSPAPVSTANSAEAPAPATAIAWRQGDVDDAFAEAADSGKPVLLYWGAVWCPPCNQLKAGLFKDPAFIALTSKFVPVYLDGDEEGAQAWGERFGVRGYPTLIVLDPQRNEITRVAGGNDAAQLTRALDSGGGPPQRGCRHAGHRPGHTGQVGGGRLAGAGRLRLGGGCQPPGR